jgi:hypothetical protein
MEKKRNQDPYVEKEKKKQAVNLVEKMSLPYLVLKVVSEDAQLRLDIFSGIPQSLGHLKLTNLETTEV